MDHGRQCHGFFRDCAWWHGRPLHHHAIVAAHYLCFLGGAAGNLLIGNVISASQTGVRVQDAGTSGNRILGNLIGTDAAGTAALGNAAQGVLLLNGASGNVNPSLAGAGR